MPKLDILPTAGSSRLDFARVAEAARADALTVCHRLLPNGRREGATYTALNPKRHDRHIGSFRVCLRRGCWRDFATGDAGGDLIALVAFLDGCAQAEAARRLATLLGVEAGR